MNWSGKDCTMPLCPNSCSSHGTCGPSLPLCSCFYGWTGSDCSISSQANNGSVSPATQGSSSLWWFWVVIPVGCLLIIGVIVVIVYFLLPRSYLPHTLFRHNEREPSFVLFTNS